MMAMIAFSQSGLTPFQQLLGHNKPLLETWTALDACLFSSNTFSAELKEEVRRTLAFRNGCEYCKAKGAPTAGIADVRTRMAVNAAILSCERAHLNDDDLNALKTVFSDSEIAELLAFICFMTACQKFGALLNLAPSCPI